MIQPARFRNRSGSQIFVEGEILQFVYALPGLPLGSEKPSSAMEAESQEQLPKERHMSA
jgi:hypothetical protein